jgi:hypothetical protein
LVARGDVVIQHDVGVGLSAIVAFIGAWLGLRYWHSGLWWDVGTAVTAFLLVGCYLWWPAPWNNPLLIVIALGVGVSGYYGTKQWLRLLVSILCVFDVYAVWLSDTMMSVAENGASTFPVQLVLMALPTEIGSLDVILSALTIIGIQRHRGIRCSLAIAAAYGGGMILIPFAAMAAPNWFASVPFLIIIAPLVLIGLSGPSVQRSRPA